MPIVVKTLREFLLGALVDFADTSGFTDLASATNLASLIVSLAHYQEEGHSLLPEVFLCRSIDAVAKTLPGAEKVEIGVRSAGALAIEEGLKRCAPLAREGWCIYFEKPSSEIRFGLFRGSLNPLAISVERTLFADVMTGLQIVRLHRFANGCVALSNQNGENHHLMLSEKAGPKAAEPTDSFKRIVSAVCKKVSLNHQDSVSTCLERILRLGLIDSHGALIAVTTSDKVPRFLQDGITLSPAIDLSACVKSRLAKTDPDDFRIEGVTSLVRGMLTSDGITVFSPTAKLLSYNCFIHASQSKERQIVGGARSRAFSALKDKLGRGLSAVFSQSQDGWMKFEELKQ